MVPQSIELLLFNRAAGRVNPDVVEMPMDSSAALAGVVGAVSVIGLALTRRRTELWRQIFTERRFEWAASLATVAFTIPVALLVRPRPAYLYSVSVLLMAILAACAFVLAGGWPVWRPLRAVMPAIMLVLIVVVPDAYGSRKHHGSQPLLTVYERLKPFQKEFVKADAVYLGERAVELHNYLGYGSGRTIDLQELAALPQGQTVADFVDREHVTLFYLDLTWFNAVEAQQPGAMRSFLASASRDWRIVGSGQTKADWWFVLERQTPSTRAQPQLPMEPR
jgi:hypothetical protein